MSHTTDPRKFITIAVKRYFLYNPDTNSILIKGDDLREKPRTFLSLEHPEFDPTRVAKFQAIGLKRKGHPSIDTAYSEYAQKYPNIIVIEELPLLSNVTHLFKK